MLGDCKSPVLIGRTFFYGGFQIPGTPGGGALLTPPFFSGVNRLTVNSCFLHGHPRNYPLYIIHCTLLTISSASSSSSATSGVRFALSLAERNCCLKTRQVARKYTPVCIQSALNSGRISARDAPILLILRNPLIPKVDGKTQANPCQKAGILLCGHEIPVMKSNGTEVKTTRSITFSRYLTRHDSINPKNTHDRI